MMQIYHNSQDTFYRTPYGACPAGETVTLRLLVQEVSPLSVQLRLWQDGAEQLLLMKQDETGCYAVQLDAPVCPQLIWYYFVITLPGQTLYYVNQEDRLGGVGELAEQPGDRSYQITVYDRTYHTPDWFKDGIMYQIFPDRFYGVPGQKEVQEKRTEYILHRDWYAPISLHPHPHEDGPACNDFYGGNLEGIRAKLPYLQSLGVSVLYLNPIFEAYSNHRYDTADYKTIDPMLGDEETFSVLCREAEEMGIRVILDGVFSHTGADSIYFNKYGTYGEGAGAYRNPASPYRNWYQFTDYPSYESWWGCSNLPNVNEMEPAYLDYILRDEDAVVKRWLKKGAKGWRLDVADELPDAFIALLRENVKETDPDAVIIGEVWEDASNKTAYGKLRSYLLGRELDSVMNYPFKEQVISFLMQRTGAEVLNRQMCGIMENYPREALYALMNIAGTHDTMRIKSVMGGMEPDSADQRMPSGMEELAFYRVRLVSFLQMTFVGVPCIYYGDEAGMQGGKDPYNRGTYPWRAVDTELRDWYREMAAMRNRYTCLRRGLFRTLFAEGGVYVYARYIIGGEDAFGGKAEDEAVICMVNRDFTAHTVTLDLSALPFQTYVRRISEKEDIRIEDHRVTLTLAPLQAEMLEGIDAQAVSKA